MLWRVKGEEHRVVVLRPAANGCETDSGKAGGPHAYQRQQLGGVLVHAADPEEIKPDGHLQPQPQTPGDYGVKLAYSGPSLQRRFLCEHWDESQDSGTLPQRHSDGK
jgi:hypothetical protein